MPTPPKSEKTGEHTSNAAGRIVEQVVGRGQLDAPNASHVRFCLQPMAAVLGVDDVGRWRRCWGLTMLVGDSFGGPSRYDDAGWRGGRDGGRGFGEGIGRWD
jgi:hypothetical protein